MCRGNQFALEENNFIFCGDFSARGKWWSSVITNQQGEDLDDVLMSINLVCLNDRRVTW